MVTSWAGIPAEWLGGWLLPFPFECGDPGVIHTPTLSPLPATQAPPGEPFPLLGFPVGGDGRERNECHVCRVCLALVVSGRRDSALNAERVAAVTECLSQCRDALFLSPIRLAGDPGPRQSCPGAGGALAPGFPTFFHILDVLLKAPLPTWPWSHAGGCVFPFCCPSAGLTFLSLPRNTLQTCVEELRRPQSDVCVFVVLFLFCFGFW
jgi:hypothetical protein